ncbi:unnamed protein product [Didymodactylos carnosus]|uniref:F-box domain-containing protein n=1 Tax=Didymodactylos carnosus TaxID=1234261 RepID=A0A816BCT2_9BILA|nr:unnamed protein product [Didymodactylos carnosus]CAF1606029.1 unnamed protein product [Didymodactylos carnosus]CAF4345856.1 unnamed protein product [Didymodactylos carnosus]CAF4485995.1 unnamed protein product [Didymodactylos carnosus]
MSSCFESMPNDLFMELFDYFDAYSIYQSFFGLNYRLNQIISHCQMYVDYHRITSSEKQKWFLENLIINRIRSLKLTNLNQIKFQYQLSSLQTLIFIAMNANDIKQILNSNLIPLQQLKFVSVNNCDGGKKDKDDVCKLLLSEHMLMLKECKLEFKYGTSFKYITPTPLLQIERLTINWCSLTNLIRLFPYLPNIKYLKVCIQRRDIAPFQSSSIVSLNNIKELHITIFDGTYERIIRLLKCCESSKLTRLKLYFFTNIYSMIDGKQWESILTQYVPYLITINLDVMFSKYNVLVTSINIDDLLLKYHWIDKHEKWRVRIVTNHRSNEIHLSIKTL